MFAQPPSYRLAGWLALSLTLVASGCERRYRLTPDRLADVEGSVGTLEGLRVYPRARFTIRHEEEQSQETFEAKRNIKIVRTLKPQVVRHRRQDAGKIVAVAQLNQMPIVWVSFDPNCDEAACALGFVQTEDKRYRLALVPRLAGYKDPEVYRRHATNRKIEKKKWMKLGTVRALAEANYVYVQKRGKRAKTVELDVRQDLRERKRPDVKTPGGYD